MQLNHFWDLFQTVGNHRVRLPDDKIMSGIELCIHDKRYKIKRSAEGSGYVSNCTLKMLYPIHAGEKSGYVGEAMHRNGSQK